MPTEKLANQWFSELLICPDCGGELSLKGPIGCSSCDFIAPSENDLRCSAPVDVTLTLSRKLVIDIPEALRGIDTSSPVISYDGPNAQRDSRGLMTEISRLLPTKGRVLDLGCGPGDQSVPVEYLGHAYVGVDYSNPKADILSDAHGLPFRNGVFDCVLSYAVLEHLHNPYIAIREIERVLRPGGIYIGTVSQGEPFHDSFFHLTTWGLMTLVSGTEKLSLMRCWAAIDTLQSLSRMGRYSRIEKKMLAILAMINQKMPFLAPRKMRWDEKEKQIDRLYRAGSIAFVIQKDPDSVQSLSHS